MDEVRYYAGLKATWGGPKPPSFQLQGSVSTKDLSVTVGYDFTSRKQKPPPTVEGLTRDNMGYVSAQEGGTIRRWQCKSVCRAGDTPSKNPEKFRRQPDK
jgi:hypothetical protein